MPACDGCVMCCKWLPVPELNKPAGVLCPDCDGYGCIIYGTIERPGVCSGFECMYYQQEKVSVDIRPDRCGVIFEKLSTQLVFGTALTGKSSGLLGQLASFQSQGYSVVLDHFEDEQLSIIPASGRTVDEVYQEFRAWQLQHTTPT